MIQSAVTTGNDEAPSTPIEKIAKAVQNAIVTAQA